MLCATVPTLVAVAAHDYLLGSFNSYRREYENTSPSGENWRGGKAGAAVVLDFLDSPVTFMNQISETQLSAPRTQVVYPDAVRESVEIALKSSAEELKIAIGLP